MRADVLRTDNAVVDRDCRCGGRVAAGAVEVVRKWQEP
jgi:hypothetical protein